MENGDRINYGQTWLNFCGRLSRYPGTQNSIILPDPGNEKGYYLIHKRIEIKTDPPVQTFTPDLSYSYIDMLKNDMKGEVITKNQSVFHTSNIVNGYLTACKHKNEKDWWLIQMKRDTNLYFKILLTHDTIMAVDSQSIGPNFSIKSNVGQAVFSPDGNKWALYNYQDDLIVYDFDRKTGDLNNLQHITFQDSAFFVGVAISPNSRFAYLCSKWDLYQVDLWEDDIQSSLTHIDHWDGFTDPTFACTFNQAQLAPDCKIYVVSSSTNNYLHVINKPDEKGKDCDFKQHSLYLPHRNYNNSIPNFPHFRMDEAEICDPTITSIFGEAIYYWKDLKAYPNPSSGVFYVDIPNNQEGKLLVFDMNGGKVYDKEIHNNELTVQLNLSWLKTGNYMIEFYPDNNSDRIIYTS